MSLRRPSVSSQASLSEADKDSVKDQKRERKESASIAGDHTRLELTEPDEKPDSNKSKTMRKTSVATVASSQRDSVDKYKVPNMKLTPLKNRETPTTFTENSQTKTTRKIE